MGLANVHLILGVVSALTGVEMLLLGHTVWAPLWIAAGVLTCWSRLGLWTVAAVALTYNLFSGDPSNHAALVFWTALTAALLVDPRRTLRVLVASVYGFATVNKLIGGPALLASHIASRGGLPEDLAQIAAVAAIVTQTFLVWAVLRSHWTALPVSAGLHAGIWVTMSIGLVGVVAMGVFNGLMVWLVWLSQTVDAGPASHDQVGAAVGGEAEPFDRV